MDQSLRRNRTDLRRRDFFNGLLDADYYLFS
jgi:hypothetical protein